MTLDDYPFGLKHKGYNGNINGVDHKYGYNGVEEENALGLDMLTMDLRQYDPAIARWTSIDPITQFDYSPYQAFNNSPVVFADPSGAVGECYTCFDSGSNGMLASPSGSFRQGNTGNSIASGWDEEEERKRREKEAKARERAGVVGGFIDASLASSNSQESSELHIFNGSQGKEEKDAYSFMWEKSKNANKEVSAFITESTVYVFPWMNNREDASYEPEGLTLKHEGNALFGQYLNVPNRKMTPMFRVLAQVHTHPNHGDLTGESDKAYSKSRKIPVYIIHPEGVGYLYRINGQKGKGGIDNSRAGIFSGSTSLRTHAKNILTRLGIL